MAMGARAFESNKLGERDTTDEDALVATIDCHGAANIGEADELGLIDVNDISRAERSVAGVSAARSEKRKKRNEQ